uniref:Uncharacterized protein n=1 Tax=Ciona intestinalis TaxID=7719 RepID=H2XSY8_CIOIN
PVGLHLQTISANSFSGPTKFRFLSRFLTRIYRTPSADYFCELVHTSFENYTRTNNVTTGRTSTEGLSSSGQRVTTYMQLCG